MHVVAAFQEHLDTGPSYRQVAQVMRNPRSVQAFNCDGIRPQMPFVGMVFGTKYLYLWVLGLSGYSTRPVFCLLSLFQAWLTRGRSREPEAYSAASFMAVQDRSGREDGLQDPAVPV